MHGEGRPNQLDVVALDGFGALTSSSITTSGVPRGWGVDATPRGDAPDGEFGPHPSLLPPVLHRGIPMAIA